MTGSLRTVYKIMGLLGQHPPSPIPSVIQICFVLCEGKRKTILKSVSSNKQWVVGIYTLWLERQFSPHQTHSFCRYHDGRFPWKTMQRQLFDLPERNHNAGHLCHPSPILSQRHCQRSFLGDGWRYQIGWIFGKVPRWVIFNPKIHIADYGPLHRCFYGHFPKKVCNMIFRKFIRFGSAIRPLVMILDI